ncbi:hypothetical protein TIFTF001_005100 [Ficus carica]|uniref:Uncharacterized protein n=1 Tax=Ficus carica TaxID=3494 RepID=A0AA87ZKV0_FICCA|nr:hypothetical protein TIFTF001_005100 [Ficus carica]
MPVISLIRIVRIKTKTDIFCIKWEIEAQGSRVKIPAQCLVERGSISQAVVHGTDEVDAIY